MVDPEEKLIRQKKQQEIPGKEENAEDKSGA